MGTESVTDTLKGGDTVELQKMWSKMFARWKTEISRTPEGFRVEWTDFEVSEWRGSWRPLTEEELQALFVKIKDTVL